MPMFLIAVMMLLTAAAMSAVEAVVETSGVIAEA
jgi:hypothetical protein